MQRARVAQGLAVVATVCAILPVASCNVALGLNKLVDCPGDPANEVCKAAAGTFDGTLDFGGTPLTNTVAGSADIFLAKLNTP